MSQITDHINCSEFSDHCARITNYLFKRVCNGITKTSDRIKEDKLNPSIEIRNPGKGKYKVFAKQEIPPGSFLMISTPLFVIPNSELPSLGTGETMEFVLKKVSSLKVNDPFLNNLFFKDGMMRDIISHNSISSPNWFGVWKSISFLSHSCMANCVYYILGDVVILKSALPIRSGDELTISYVSIFGSPLNRERDLENIRGCKCDCSLCTKPIEPYSVTIERDEMKNIVEVLYPIIFGTKGPFDQSAIESFVDSLYSDNWRIVRTVLNNVISVFIEGDNPACMNSTTMGYRALVKVISALCGDRFDFEMMGLYSFLSINDTTTETLKDLAKIMYRMGDSINRTELGIAANILVTVKLSVAKNPLMSKLMVFFWEKIGNVYFTKEMSEIIYNDPLILLKIR